MTYIPEAPEDLDEEGAMWWYYYCDVFLEGGVLRRTYLTSLHNLCLAHVLRKQYIDCINEAGPILYNLKAGPDGLIVKHPYPNPACKDLTKLMLDMDRLLGSLGMTAYTDHVLQYENSRDLVGKSKTIGPPAFSPVLDPSAQKP